MICNRHETSDLCEESEAEQERADMEAQNAEFGEPNPVKPYVFPVRNFGEGQSQAASRRNCAGDCTFHGGGGFALADSGPKRGASERWPGRAGDWPLAFRRSAVRIW